MDNTANFEALKAATLGAQAIQTPGSTLGASNAPEIAAMYQSSFQLPQSQAATVGAAGVAGDIMEQRRAAAAAAARAAAEAKAKEEDLADPKKYRRVKKSDGGYDFFAPDGSQVDIATLTQRTQTKARDWVDDSENPIDIQYLEESKNLNDYIKAKLTKNEKVYQAYEEANPELKQYQDKGGVDRLINQFKQRYERYYVPRSVNPNAWGTRPSDNPLIPSRNVDPYDLGGDGGIGA